MENAPINILIAALAAVPCLAPAQAPWRPTATLNDTLPPPPLRQNLYLPVFSPQNQPFFCRIEHRWNAGKPQAFKFRLGSVEYVDTLEGKNTHPTF